MSNDFKEMIEERDAKSQPKRRGSQGSASSYEFMKKKKVGGDTISAMRDTFRTATRALFHNKLT